MKKLIHLIAAAAASIATMAYAGTAIHSLSIESPDPINKVFIGNSIGWDVRIHADHRVASITRYPRDATATNLIFLTPGGVVTYDIAQDGRTRPNDDRRILRDGETLELAPLRASVLELPADVKQIRWTRSVAQQLQIVIDHRYVALKYVPLPDNLKIKEPRRLTVTTASGSYSFDVVNGAGGAPLYRVVDGN
jgi:hypothetical protein